MIRNKALHLKYKQLLDAGNRSWAVLARNSPVLRWLRNLLLRSPEQMVPEELRHATHSVELRQAPEHVSLIRIDFNLIWNFMQS